MKAMHDYLGERFVAGFQLAAIDPEKQEATIRLFDPAGAAGHTLTVSLPALETAINESIVLAAGTMDNLPPEDIV